jgi:hypothetical protein
MAPTTQDLMIVINNVDVTLRIRKDTLRVEQRAASQISTASFEIDKAQSLGLTAWQTVLISSPDYTTVHFIGYLTRFTYRKRGVDLTYVCECQSVAVRLQKAVVDPGTYTGYNTDVLGDLLDNATPDLSDMFTFSPLVDSQIDEFGLEDYAFDVGNDTLLDALNAFGELNNANWNVETSQNVDINYFPNPNLTNDMKYCSGDISIGGNYGPAGWNAANVVWTAGAGESGAGLVISSQLVGGTHYATCVLGYDASDYATLFRQFPSADDMHLYMSFRCKISDGTAADSIWFTMKDVNGTTLNLGGGIGGGDGTVSTSWSTIGHGYALGYTDTPVDFHLMMTPLFQRDTTAFTIYIDKIMVELFAADPFPTASKNSYYDGSDSGVEWMGTPNDSASLLYTDQNQLNWRQDADAASFNLDIGNMSEYIEDFEYSSVGFDYVNQLIVTGGTTWSDVLWEYPGDGQLTHFDLELEIYPDSGSTVPSIDKNTGTDGTPSWTAQTVKIRDSEATLGGGTDVLWDPERHWLEFDTAPSLLKRAFRVDGRIKEHVRVTVSDQEEIDDSGLTLVEPYHNDAISSEEDALAVGNAQLAKRAAPSCRFKTYEPGLEPNRVIAVTDSAGGLSAVDMTILSVTWQQALGGGYFIFDVEAGEPEPDLVDIIAGIDKKASDALAPTVDSATVTLEPLTLNGEVITKDGVTLYKRT